MERDRDRETERQKQRQTERQKRRQTDRQSMRENTWILMSQQPKSAQNEERKTGWQTDGQTDR